MTYADSNDDNVATCGLDKLMRGRRAIAHARYLSSIEGPSEEAEQKSRTALGTLRSAMDWLEDTQHFETAHKALDQAGRFVRQTFGCHLTMEQGTYWETCPVSLAHNRVGMSPAVVIGAAECSVCGLDPEDDGCVHVTGRVYDGEACVRVITEVSEVLEVSVVARPAQPDARIQRLSISPSALTKRLGPRFRPGMPVNCDICLTECKDIRRPFENCRTDSGALSPDPT